MEIFLQFLELLILFNSFVNSFNSLKVSNESIHLFTRSKPVIVDNLKDSLWPNSKDKLELITDLKVQFLGTPNKVGQIKYDIEVKDSLQNTKSPEIIESQESYFNYNNNKPDLEFDFVPTHKQIGQIEFDVEVQEVLPQDVSRVPQMNALSEKSSDHFINELQSKMASKGVKFFQMDLGLDSGINNTNQSESQTTTQSSDITLTDNNTENASSESETETSRQTNAIITIITTITTTSELTELNTEISPKNESIPKQPSKETTYPIWPIILLAVFFVLIALTSVCWAISAYCKATKAEEEDNIINSADEHIVPNATISGTSEPPNSVFAQDIESGGQTTVAAEPETSPDQSNRSADSNISRKSTKSSESSK